ncbi:MAG: aldo/keto reductase [Rhizobiales bacterium]|nr:aldo/keto reductase [Hyphomicrobiales bacterium]MBO6699404.1 aldo/keto reductase [Hyphomicrobiales bacterium]MBO6736942.1 aldo/keto reductase [Hyphomicrobiales bacterium]MBO6911984.1 aldo/keto reductase [Hyphomicrobiales bacterium]MBO6954648.1 aldo/keto reductase [Hyphomicrobiales bacterium]
MGCWAIGGPFYAGDDPLGYANADDAQSLAAIEASYETGIRLFDTADVYGAGHSERLLGRALKGRDEVLISTKFGLGFDEVSKQVTGERADTAYVRQALDASRKRLDRDVLDIVFLHLNSLPPHQAAPLFDALETARSDGVINAYGWSTDFPASAEAMADRERFVAVQHAMNVFFDAPSMMAVVDQHSLLSFNRSPLAMGLLTGKFVAGQAMASDDIRQNSFEWMDYFKDGRVAPEFIAMLDTVRELLTVGGRSLAQGALGWLLAKSPNTVPIPGARTAEQATHNAQALALGPLPGPVMDEIEQVLTRPPEGPPRER